jgi:hypothetical protein
MAVDIYQTRTMLAAMRQEAPTNMFLLDTLFRRVETFNTEHVDIDIVKGDERLAPFVSPRVEGKLMEDQGFTTRSYKPGYVKPKYVTPAADLVKDRVAGENIYQGDAPSRSEIRLAKNLADGENQIARREEWMAAQGLVNGTVDVVGDGVNYQIDFGMSASHKVTLAGTSLWSDATNSKPLNDLSDWSTLIADDGNANANIMVGGKLAIQALFENTSVKNALDTRRINMGEIKPSQLAPGVTYFGTLIANGVNIDVYQYVGSYKDDNGVRQRYIPDDRVILTSTEADFRRNFGAIADLDAGLVSMMAFPKTWMSEDPSARHVLIQSAPLPAPHQIDAIVTAKVV